MHAGHAARVVSCMLERGLQLGLPLDDLTVLWRQRFAERWVQSTRGPSLSSARCTT